VKIHPNNRIPRVGMKFKYIPTGAIYTIVSGDVDRWFLSSYNVYVKKSELIICIKTGRVLIV
jgi:hypothetical protein